MDKIDLILIFAIALGLILILIGLLGGFFVLNKSLNSNAKPIQNLPYNYWPYFLAFFIVAILVILLVRHFLLK